jgi:hypothetical protein
VLGIVVMILGFYDVDQCLDTMAILAFVGATELEATESTMAIFWLIISHRANHFEDQVRYFFLTVMNLVYDYSSNQDIDFFQGEYMIDTHANSIVTTMSWFFAENFFIDFVSQKNLFVQKTGANTPPGTVKAAAISAWSLLLSTLDPKRVSSSQHVQM